MGIDNKYIIEISGKKFIQFDGLLVLFHENKGKSIETEEVASSTATDPRFKATVSGDKGTFTGHGDANDSNVGAMVKVHKYRMAETRAIARALRLYNNIGLCSVEELGGDKYEEHTTEAPKAKLLKRLESLAGKKLPNTVIAFDWIAKKIEEKTGIKTDGQIGNMEQQTAKNILEAWQN